MDAKQHLYYALGALAYAVAKADGKVQREEREKVQQIVESGSQHSMDFGYTDIIFQLLQKDKAGFKEVYEWAMKSFDVGKYHLSDEMKNSFIGIIEQVAAAFPPTDPEELVLITRFSTDLNAIHVNKVID